jgi:hypothetical protein
VGCKRRTCIQPRTNRCVTRRASGTSWQTPDCPASRSRTDPELAVRSLVAKAAVGAPGFEPGTSWSQTRRATGLRYAPS